MTVIPPAIDEDLDLGRVMGIGRWGVVSGVTIVLGGFFLARPTIAWGGVVIAMFALLLNAAGKGAYYAQLSIPREQRLLLIATWLAVVLIIAALLVDYTYARLTTGYESLFWAFTIGAVGLSGVYRGLRMKYVTVEPSTEHN